MPLQIGMVPLLAVRLLGSMVNVWTPLSETSRVRARVDSWTRSVDRPLLVNDSCCDWGVPGWPTKFTWLGLRRSPPPLGARCSLWRIGPGRDSASFTAAPTLSRPAPCSSAGASMSVAVLTRISLDQRRRRIGTAVGLGVRLDHVRGGGRSQRG